MRSEKEIRREINRLNRCIAEIRLLSKLYREDSDTRIQYELEIHKIENDIQRLKWVLE